MQKGLKSVLGAVFGKEPPSRMEVFLDGYIGFVPRGFAENIVSALGGWDSFTKAAVVIQKDNSDLSIVDRFIDDKSAIELFNENPKDVERFMRGYYQLDDIDRPKRSNADTPDNNITFGQLTDSFSNGLRFIYYKHVISTEILIARFVIHSAVQILSRKYDLYRCAH